MDQLSKISDKIDRFQDDVNAVKADIEMKTNNNISGTPQYRENLVATRIA
jgi:hypothetical protein